MKIKSSDSSDSIEAALLSVVKGENTPSIDTVAKLLSQPIIDPEKVPGSMHEYAEMVVEDSGVVIDTFAHEVTRSHTPHTLADHVENGDISPRAAMETLSDIARKRRAEKA